jgi:hypothetical protein
MLNARLKTIRLKRSRKLLKRYAKNRHRDILFTDEKNFDIEEKYNKQNDRVYATSSEEAKKQFRECNMGIIPHQ